MPDYRWHLRRAYDRYRLRRLVRRNDFAPREALTLFTDPRGGSTWLTEQLVQIPKTTVVWEPLHADLTPGLRELEFQWRQHIPENATWDEARDFFERILRGRVLSLQPGQVPYLDHFPGAERLIVKFCRGTALLPWFVRTFEPRFAPIHFIRHPFSVAASQLQFGAWDTHPETFRMPEGRFTEPFDKHADFLATLSSRAESLVARWCIVNGIALDHPARDEHWITATYEHMLLDPESTITRIFDRWGLPMPEGVLDRVREASRMTKDATFETSLDDQLTKWQRQFTDNQIARLTRILDHFEIEVYTNDPMPQVTF